MCFVLNFRMYLVTDLAEKWPDIPDFGRNSIFFSLSSLLYFVFFRFRFRFFEFELFSSSCLFLLGRGNLWSSPSLNRFVQRTPCTSYVRVRPSLFIFV